MTKQDKIKQIKKWYREGRITRWGSNSFLVPFEAFVLGIIPELVSEALNKKDAKSNESDEGLKLAG